MLLTEAADRANPPIAPGVGLSGPWRSETLSDPSIAARWAAKVWRTRGLEKSPLHF